MFILKRGVQLITGEFYVQQPMWHCSKHTCYIALTGATEGCTESITKCGFSTQGNKRLCWKGNYNINPIPVAPRGSTLLQHRRLLCIVPSHSKPSISDTELCSYWHLNWGLHHSLLTLDRGNPGVEDQRVSHKQLISYTDALLKTKPHSDPILLPSFKTQRPSIFFAVITKFQHTKMPRISSIPTYSWLRSDTC